MSGKSVDLAAFQNHVKTKSPAFIPLFKDKSRYQVAWGGAGSGPMVGGPRRATSGARGPVGFVRLRGGGGGTATQLTNCVAQLRGKGQKGACL